MDAGTILIASATYLAAAVARRPADELGLVLWGRVKGAIRGRLGRDPKPSDLSSGALTQAIAEDPGLGIGLEQIYGESSALRRAALASSVLKGTRLLWVDDHPEYTAWERTLVETFGVTIVTVESTRSALACLAQGQFDLVLSDIAREGRQREGLDALAQFKTVRPNAPVVFYVANLTSEGTPRGAQGITNRPDELLHLVLDCLERTRL